MGFWTAVVIIVAIGMFGQVATAKYKQKSKNPPDFYNNIDHRLSRLEDRMANIETIVLEKERYKEYDKI